MSSEVKEVQRQPLSERLVRSIRAKPVTNVTLECAALLVLDTFANALAGRNTAIGKILRAWADRQPVDAARDALAIGALAHVLEVDDLHRASVVHPGCVVVPAAYAVARREGRSGRDFLVAVLHGYEAVCRIGAAVGAAHYRVWHNTASCGPFGSATAASTVLGLDVDATVNALGNAGTQAFGLWEFMESPTMTKPLHAGRAAEAGVTAADLASFGLTGPPRILEGRRGFFSALCPDAKPENVLQNPEAPWQLEQTSVKPWMCCRHTHPAIEAALAIRRELDVSSIERIAVGAYQAAIDVCDKPVPGSEVEAKFSLQHAVALALLDGRIDFTSFGEEARRRVAPLRSRVALWHSDEVEAAYPDAWGAEVEVVTTDCTTHAHRARSAKGDPESPLSRAELVDKARMLLTHGLVEDPESLIESVLATASDGPLPEIAFSHAG